MVRNTSADRRHELRIRTTLRAYILRGAAADPVDVLNVSYQGLFFACAGVVPPLGQLLRIRLELSKTTIEVHAFAVHIATDVNGRAGVGLRFFALEGDALRLWNRFVAGLIAAEKLAA